MQASTLCTPTKDHIGTIFVAIELSQRSWLVTIHAPDRDRMSRHKLAGGDHIGLLALIGKVRMRAEQKLGAAPAVVSCTKRSSSPGFGCSINRRAHSAAGSSSARSTPASGSGALRSSPLRAS